MKQKPIYLDYNATTPIDLEVIDGAIDIIINNISSFI